MGLVWYFIFIVFCFPFFVPLPVRMSLCFKNFACLAPCINYLGVRFSIRVDAFNFCICGRDRLSRAGLTLCFLLQLINLLLVIWFATGAIRIMRSHRNCSGVLGSTGLHETTGTYFNAAFDRKRERCPLCFWR